MKTIVPAIILFLTFSFKLQAQNVTIEGIVLDSTKQALSAATVVLLQQKDSVMVSFGITDAQGRFKMKKISAGQYLLQVSFVGYDSYSQILSFTAADNPLVIDPVVLSPASTDLNEVLVKAEHIPIQMRRDTIVYNADAFKVREGAAVEELLKKLPGVEVDRAGNIKAQGEDVNKVYVDGKEFFGDDPKIATKNLPADAIDKVEVYDKKSDMAEFSGIDDGQEEKTINLELKEDKKQGYFGNISAGYGTEQRFESKANVNRFGKKAQFSALGMANNINQQGFSFNDYLGFMGGMSNMMMAGSGSGSFKMSLSDSQVPLDMGRGTGFTNTYSGGINFNYDFKPKTRLNFSYFYNQLQNEQDRYNFRENLVGDQAYISEEEELKDGSNSNHRMNTTFRSDIDSFQQIIFRANLRFTDAWANSLLQSKTFNFEDQLENLADRQYNTNGSNLSVSSILTYRKRFRKKGRVLSMQGRWGMGENEQEAFLNSITTLFPSDPELLQADSLDQRQFRDNSQKNYQLQFSFTEPLAKKLYLELKYTRQNFADRTVKEFYDTLSGDARLNTNLSDRYRRDYFYDRTGLSLQYNRKKIKTTTALNWQHSQLNGTLQNEPFSLDRSFDFLLPSFRLNYEMSTGRSLSFDYFTQVQEPSVEQLQPVVDNSDPLNISVGNPDLQPEYRHIANLQFMFYDQFSFTSLFAGVMGVYTTNKITMAQSIDSLFRRTSMPINVDNDLLLNLYFSFDTPLRFMYAKINLDGNLQLSRSQVFINDMDNIANRLNSSYKISLENRKQEVVSAKAGLKFNYNNTKYSINSELDQNFWTPSYFADLNIDFKNNWSFSTIFDYYVYPAQQFGERLEVPIWEASVSKSFLKNNRGMLRLSVFDLLNKNLGVSRTSNFNYIQEERILSLGRYFMLSFTYKLSGFGSSAPGWDMKVDFDRH